MITVTSPLLPPLDDFLPYLRDIWERKWITNSGHYHQLLEEALAKYLGVEYLSLFTNGTLPLMTALQALNLQGEVITTPYSFVATTHALWWCGLKPVFVDVDPLTGNLDPDKIEAAITSHTTAILPVHVYGQPCRVTEIQAIAQRHGLKVIYDAAHAFGVSMNGTSILSYGDLSTLSFHATKTYNTIEGGALVCETLEMKQRIDQLKNFGFTAETEVAVPGINGKMDEIRSAYGLLQLKGVDRAIERRKEVADAYTKALMDIPGVSVLSSVSGVKYNYSYFPIFVNEKEYGESRDGLYKRMKGEGVLGRRYFYPLISEFTPYRHLPSSAKENLPNAHRLADSVICLPMHHLLTESDVCKILSLIRHCR